MKKFLYIYFVASFIALVGGYGPWSAQANSEDAVRSNIISEVTSVVDLHVYEEATETVVRPYGFNFGHHTQGFICELTEEEEDEDDKKHARKYVDVAIPLVSELISFDDADEAVKFHLFDGHPLSLSARGLYIVFEVFRI